MADFSQWWWQAAGVDPGPGPGPNDPGDPIGQSLRFRPGSFLERAVTTAGDSTTWTWSGWLKVDGTGGTFFAAGPGGAVFEHLSPSMGAHFRYTQQSMAPAADTAASFRDPSAWHHVIQRMNAGTLETFVNSVQQTLNNSTPTNNNINATGTTQYIGANRVGAASSGGGYLADCHFIDGQALDPTAFGRYNTAGVWVPVDYSGGNYGTNGFYLDFSDSADIGADRSGNGNDFTPNGFELADQTSTDYDLMQDSPTQNWATLNPLQADGGMITYEKANLASKNQSTTIAFGTQAGGAFGKYYFEQHRSANSEDMFGVGEHLPSTPTGSSATAASVKRGLIWYQQATRISWYLNGTYEQVDGKTMPNDCVFKLAFDVEAGSVWVGYNDQWLDSSKNPTASFTEGSPTFSGLDLKNCLTIHRAPPSSANGAVVNFGQQPFLYTPPAGFEELQTQNLPAAPIANGRDHFQAITGPGADILTTAQATFDNGLWWIKDRANTNQHQLVDSVNGTSAVITSPAGSVTAYAAPAGDSVAWCWNAANTDGGFSISDGTHGLGTTPAMVIDRALNVWHQSLPAGQGLVLKTNAAATSQSWTVDGTTVSGPGGGSYYSWSEIPGYSAFGSYTGNGNADGPFVYTGFKVAFLLFKRSDANANWEIRDTTRTPNNPSNITIYPSQDWSEPGPDSLTDMDLLSNGFKLRNGQSNSNQGNMIYAAFAENPFQAPATAR